MTTHPEASPLLFCREKGAQLALQTYGLVKVAWTVEQIRRLLRLPPHLQHAAARMTARGDISPELIEGILNQQQKNLVSTLRDPKSALSSAKSFYSEVGHKPPGASGATPLGKTMGDRNTARVTTFYEPDYPFRVNEPRPLKVPRVDIPSLGESPFSKLTDPVGVERAVRDVLIPHRGVDAGTLDHPVIKNDPRLRAIVAPHVKTP